MSDANKLEIEQRKPLTKRQRSGLDLRQGGLCGCGCAVKLDHAGEGTIDEHVIPLAKGGSNDLSNRQLWRKPCAAEKTKADIRSINKAKRQGLERGQQARRAAGKTKSIPSGGWAKGKKVWPKRQFPKREKN